MRPRNLRNDLHKASLLPPPIKAQLPPGWLLQRVPTDVLAHIISLLPATADVAACECVCRALRDEVIPDALRRYENLLPPLDDERRGALFAHLDHRLSASDTPPPRCVV